MRANENLSDTHTAHSPPAGPQLPSFAKCATCDASTRDTIIVQAVPTPTPRVYGHQLATAPATAHLPGPTREADATLSPMDEEDIAAGKEAFASYTAVADRVHAAVDADDAGLCSFAQDGVRGFIFSRGNHPTPLA